MFYDLLHSPDGIVPDVRATASRLVGKLGLIEPRESWYQVSQCHGYEALFARVHPSRVMAPSRLEVIAARPQRQVAKPADIQAYIDAAARWQGARPVKTHATVLTSSSFGELREHLLRVGVRHRVDPPSDDLGHERLWVGLAPGEGPLYHPDDDSGVLFEVIPTQCLGLPDEVATGDISAIAPAGDGAMTRVAARTFLVEDLPAVLKTLETRLCWPAERVIGPPGARRAVMAANYPRSARFELCEPGYDEDTGPFFAAWGAGTFATRIAVQNIDAKLGDLSERGVGVRRVSPAGGGSEVARIEESVVPGFIFEFIDEDAVE